MARRKSPKVELGLSKSPKLELGLEFLASFLLFAYPYGADQMGIAHNFWIGLASWILGLLILIRMFWIFPWWADRISRNRKTTISFAVACAFIALVWNPVKAAYSRRDFFIVMEVSWTNSGMDAWFVHQGSYCRAPLGFWIDLTNNQSVWSLINKFEVDAETQGGHWRRVEVIDTTSGDLYMGPFAHAMKVKAAYFDKAMENKNLAPQETISGWLYMELPTSENASGVFRFRISDMAGHSYNSGPIAPRSTPILRSSVQIDSGPPLDLSKLKLNQAGCFKEWNN